MSRIAAAGLLLEIICLIFAMSVLFPPHGCYYGLLDVYYCDSPKVCLHELGHKSDRHMGYVTKTDEYKMALATFAQSDHPWASYVKGNPTEIYAWMLEYGPEYVPEELRGFYDWNTIKRR